jgi:hypothetical protein
MTTVTERLQRFAELRNTQFKQLQSIDAQTASLAKQREIVVANLHRVDGAIDALTDLQNGSAPDPGESEVVN